MNSKGISVLFLIIAMLLMVTIGYVFSYLIPTKQKGVSLVIHSNQAFFIAQSGVEFAVRYAKDQCWTTPSLLNNLNTPPNNTRNLGNGKFTLDYDSVNDKLTSTGEVPNASKRIIVVSNFTSLLGCSFTYRKSITVQSGQVSGGPHTDFPMLVSFTDPNLKTIADGGRVTNSNGYDIIFRALDSTTCGGTAPCTLYHEVEKYVASTGELVAWVKVPSINTGTVIYMYYGNSCITSSTENPTGVWDANYKGVWHLKETTGGAGAIKDSTSNANHGTDINSLGFGATGKIGNAVSLNGTDITGGYFSVPDSASLDVTNAEATIQMWIKWTNPGDKQRLVMVSSNRFSATPVGSPTPDGYEWSSQALPGGHFFYPWGGSGSNYNMIANPFTSGVFHHLVVTMKDTTVREVKFYVDSALKTLTTTNVPTYWTTLASPANWLWGGNPDRNTRFFAGAFDEIRVSNVVRSAGWILTEYKNMSSPSTFYSVGSEECSP